MTVAADDAVRLEIFIEAPPHAVFAFFTDVEKMRRWMGVTHQLEPRPGGAWHVEVRPGNVARGEFKEVVPHRRIVFSWGWEKGGISGIPPGSTTVEISLEPERSGTRLRLVHTGLPGSATGDHAKGWTHFLGRLAVAGAGGDPGPDRPGEST